MLVLRCGTICLRPGCLAGKSRLRFHSHKRHPDSAFRDIWQKYAIRRHHWKSSVSVGQRWRDAGHPHLQQICRAGKGAVAEVSIDGYSLSMDGIRSWS